MWIVAAAVLVSLMVWFLLAPLFEPALSFPQSEDASDHRTSLLDAKERSVRALKDLELDFAMGKVGAEDFEHAKRALSAEVAGVLQELKKT
jgi:hypothetical protein